MGYKRYAYNIESSKNEIYKEELIKEIEELIKKIEKTRESLYILIEVSNNIGSEEIIMESQKLDKLLTAYEKLKSKEYDPECLKI